MARTARWIGIGCALILGGFPAFALSFSGSSGNLAASVTFDIVSITGDSYLADGNYLQVVLTNTSTADVLVPTDVLTAVFFTYSGPALTPGTAYLTDATDSVLFGSAPGGNVGGEWAYEQSLSGPNGANAGISSTGVGLFGSGNFHNFTNLQGPASVNGLQYGITSAGDNPLTGNTPVTGSNALIQNSVTFLLGGVGNLSIGALSISNVSFQYGTSLTEPNIPSDDPGQPVPEPATLTLLGLGMAGLAMNRLRKRVSS